MNSTADWIPVIVAQQRLVNLVEQQLVSKPIDSREHILWRYLKIYEFGDTARKWQRLQELGIANRHGYYENDDRLRR